jgi:hypothetical protein
VLAGAYLIGGFLTHATPTDVAHRGHREAPLTP